MSNVFDLNLSTKGRELTEEQWNDLQASINADHPGLQVVSCGMWVGQEFQQGWLVQTLFDDGSVCRDASETYQEILLRLYDYALERGWVSSKEDVVELDLGQFDPFDLGYCAQMAAFGKQVVN